MTTSPARANLIGRIVSAVMETYFECKGSGWATPCAEAVDAILPHADPVAVASEAAEADGITLLRIYGDAVERGRFDVAADVVQRVAGFTPVEDKPGVFVADRSTSVFAQPPPANPEPFDFRAHLSRQRRWSADTFGPGDRAKGVVDHIRKELVEIEAEPHDLTEWIDVVILALDGAWRTGATPDAIIAALAAKQAKNEARTWPDWRTQPPDAAITHVKCDEETRRQIRERAR